MHVMPYLKSIKIVSHSTQAKHMSNMQLLALNEKFLSNPDFGGPVMSGAFFARTSILQGV